MSSNKLSFTKMRSTFFFSLIVILGIAILYIIRPFVYPVFWAAIIAILFYPVYTRIHKHIKSDSLSSLTTLLIVIIVLFLPLTLLSTLLINESIELYKSASDANLVGQVEGVGDWLKDTAAGPYIEEVSTNWTRYATNATKLVSVSLFNNIKNITQNSLRFFLMFFIMLYTLFYFLKDGSDILKRLMHLSPLGDKYEKMLYQKFTSTARATLKGTLIIGGIQGILGGILFWITGVQGALIWGVVMIVLSIIPAVGSFIVWLPVGIIMLVMGSVWQGLAIIIVGATLIGNIDNFLRPPLVGKDIQMHPLLVLFSTLGGIILFGISGFIIGPVIAALFTAVVGIYDHHYKNELQNN